MFDAAILLLVSLLGAEDYRTREVAEVVVCQLLLYRLDDRMLDDAIGGPDAEIAHRCRRIRRQVRLTEPFWGLKTPLFERVHPKTGDDYVNYRYYREKAQDIMEVWTNHGLDEDKRSQWATRLYAASLYEKEKNWPAWKVRGYLTWGVLWGLK